MTDWLTLAYPDGDAGGVERAATSWQQAAFELEGLAGPITSAISATEDGWKGFAMLAFLGQSGTTENQLKTVGAAHGEAAEALAAYALQLADAQGRVKQAQATMNQLLDAYASASARQASALAAALRAAAPDALIPSLVSDAADRVAGYAAPAARVTLDPTDTDPQEVSLGSIEAALGGDGWAVSTLLVDLGELWSTTPAAVTTALDACGSTRSSTASELYAARHGGVQAALDALTDAGTAANTVEAAAEELVSAFGSGSWIDAAREKALAEQVVLGEVNDPKMRAALQKALDGVQGDPNSLTPQQLAALEAALSGLPADERHQVVDSMTEGGLLDDLSKALAGPPAGMFSPHWPNLGGLGRNPALQNFYNLLFGSASGSNIPALTGLFPDVNPSLSGVDDWDKHHAGDDWTPVNGTLLDGLTVNPNDVNQGGVGDCYFLSSLIAVAQQDPSFITSHMHDNGNGTTTITLYKDGKPVQITVVNSVPTSTNPGYWNSGQDAVTSSGGYWVEMYEKAYAQLRGGYGSIEGGWGRDGLGAVTGQSVDTHGTSSWSWVPVVGGPSTPQVSVQQLADELNSGHAIVVGTKDNDVDAEYAQAHKLIGGHEYVVQSVDPKTGTVTLRNPWDPNDCPTMSWDDMKKQLDEVAWTKP